MPLHDVIVQIRSAMDKIPAEPSVDTLLRQGALLINDEQDETSLITYANYCNDRDLPECEELALRKLLLGPYSYEAMGRLIPLLQERQTCASDVEKIELIKECIQLITTTLDHSEIRSGLMWANLVHIRAINLTKLAKAGDLRRCEEASADMIIYIDWLVRGDESVPSYLQRDNLVAVAEIELGEILLLRGDAAGAARLLERSIETLERNKAFEYIRDYAYEMLGRAWGTVP